MARGHRRCGGVPTAFPSSLMAMIEVLTMLVMQMAEAKGPGARAKFAAFRMLSPALRMRLQRLRKDKEQDESILVPGLRSKLWSLFEAMPVCPDFTRRHPHAVNDIMASYLKHQSERRGSSVVIIFMNPSSPLAIAKVYAFAQECGASGSGIDGVS